MTWCWARAEHGSLLCRLELFREMNEQHTLFEIVTDKYAKTQMTHKRERPELVRPNASSHIPSVPSWF